MATATKTRKKTSAGGNGFQLKPAGVRDVDLKDIVGNTAQSRGMGVLANLAALDYGLFPGDDIGVSEPNIIAPENALWPLLISDASEDRKRAAALIAEHEPELVELADSFLEASQLQPVGALLLPGNQYDIIYGMRRALGVAFNHARDVALPTTVEVKVFEGQVSRAERRLMALEENEKRRDESPMDVAITFQRLRDEDGLTLESIAKRRGWSVQNVRNYLHLLDAKLEDKRLAIHLGELSVDRALKLLRKRRGGSEAAREQSNGDKRYRLPSVKTMIRIYEADAKPAGMKQKEWELWTLPDVRRFLAFKLGLRYSEFKGVVKEEKEDRGTATDSNGDGAARKVKTLPVKRSRAQNLLVSLGKVNARTWGDDKLRASLEDIVNLVEEGQEAEEPSLQGLLDKLVEGYREGVKVRITEG